MEEGTLDELLGVVEDLDVDVALQRPHLPTPAHKIQHSPLGPYDRNTPRAL